MHLRRWPFGMAPSCAPVIATTRQRPGGTGTGWRKPRKATFAAMAAVVDQGCAQLLQHLILNSPWRHKPVVAQIGQDADRLPGGEPIGCLVIDPA